MKYLPILLIVFFAGIDFTSAVRAESPSFSLPSQTTDTPLKINSKPHPSARACPAGKGTTGIKVTFDKSARVTEAVPVSSSGCEQFDKDALRAAKKIKFEPAKKDGVAITTEKLVEYGYTVVYPVNY